MVPIFVFGGDLAGVVDESVEAPDDAGRDAELALLESLTAAGGVRGGAV